ncbi:MAG: hypothetical protein QNK24_09420 [Desulfuromusa sp.]|nr:hypothetical protein [Desulfuromusa sp.]
MAEQTDNQQLFLREAGMLIEKIRTSLRGQAPDSLLLADSIQAVTDFKQNTIDVEVDSFRSIVDRLEVVLGRHLTARTIPSKIELETVGLAVDWLAQLAILYVENLPEPKSLVAELLYTFDLVECSQDAASLAELVAEHAEKDASPHTDPFLDDPDFDVVERLAPSHRDPFAGDPGFGLEFDLLQRTINFVVEARTMGDDPFSEDPSLDSKGEIKQHSRVTTVASAPPYDFFAGDPPLIDKPDT